MCNNSETVLNNCKFIEADQRNYKTKNAHFKNRKLSLKSHIKN